MTPVIRPPSHRFIDSFMNHSDPPYSRPHNLILHANRFQNWIFNELNEQRHLQRCHIKILYSQCNCIRLICRKELALDITCIKYKQMVAVLSCLLCSNMSWRVSVIYNNIISHSKILANCSIHKYTDSSSSFHREKTLSSYHYNAL